MAVAELAGSDRDPVARVTVFEHLDWRSGAVASASGVKAGGCRSKQFLQITCGIDWGSMRHRQWDADHLV